MIATDKLPERTRRFFGARRTRSQRQAEAFAAAGQLRDAGVPKAKRLTL